MKILVLQLARLGDIFTTWPVLRALRRKYPEAEIKFLVRKRFQEACLGLTEVNNVVCLDSENLLSPLLADEVDVAASVSHVSQWLDELRREKFDLIINLSFSPSSSYLTHLIAQDQREVCGYSRFSDGSLQICDEVSAYFYAQVGLNRQNRIHTAELMAGVAGVKLSPSDWTTSLTSTFNNLQSPYFAIHVGASQEGKSYSANGWSGAMTEILKWWDGHIYLIGATNEVEKANQILNQVGSKRLQSLVGKTAVSDLFPVVGAARLLIGCDSSPIHVASLTNTACLNLSFSTVNFWETGPKAKGSRVLWAASPETLKPAAVSEEARCLLNNEASINAIVAVDGPCVPYRILCQGWPEFQWALIQYIYFAQPWPKPTKKDVLEGALRLNEVNQLALEQIHTLLKNPKNSPAVQILDRVDEMFQVLQQLVPDLAPLVRWLQTQKSLIPPGPLSEVLENTLHAHRHFSGLLSGIQINDKETSP